MAAPKSVKQLIETFGNNIGFYKSNQYNEAQLRQEFLDPFFKELGWDMDNTAGLAPQYRDVIHEASIKIGGSTKAPDYAFSIHGQYKFFLEAKKPYVNLKNDIDPAYQLRRYGWSAKLPISILTDFEEFAIYDCRKRPKRGECTSISRLGYFKYTDYLEKWDELCTTFSKEAILKGSFDKYTVDAKRHRGTETVDDAFLGEIENWRNLLARNFALRNPELTVRDLNFVVQKTIDRIIFLRICEDRGTEDYKRLATLLNGGRIYPRLLDHFKLADARYNSGLFHFSTETGRSAPDEITPNIQLDDKVLKEIISKLYYPESPYEFSVLPADILGQVYEQFLGKTIHLTAGHKAKIEEKPEVRKAGGVYYTPSYIVDYIIKHTLGHLLDGNDPKKLKPIAVSKAADIKVLDPACGSGSFLIVAYQYLLDWHLRQYTADPETNESDPGKIKRHFGGKNPKIYQSPGGEWKLTTYERKRILLNNIFGVDIDSQAVEVTKLSLLLKVIEGETHQVLQRDWIRERQRILPDLDNNIKCGNSLISPDFYDDEQMLLLDEETQYRINVFDWDRAFTVIMQRGGFNCVIGNPPYRQVTDPNQLPYFKKHYEVCEGRIDLFELFIEKANTLTLEGNAFSFIVPAPVLTNQFSRKTRHLLARQNVLNSITTFSFPVFADPTVHTCVILSTKGASGTTHVYAGLDNPNALLTQPSYMVDKNKLLFGETDVINVFITPTIRSLLDRLSKSSESLGNLCQMRQCIKTGDDEIHLKLSETNLNEPWKPTLQGRGMNRYEICETRLWLNYGSWLARNWKNRDFYERPKIGIRETGSRLTATLDIEQRYFLSSLYSVYFKNDGQPEKLNYLLGILNSELASWLASIFALSATKGAFTKFRTNQLAPLPIRTIDFNNPDDVAKHDTMVGLVERMLKLNAKKADKSNPETMRLLETQLSATDRQIDRLVYDLYCLTKAEIELVEQGATLG